MNNLRSRGNESVKGKKVKYLARWHIRELKLSSSFSIHYWLIEWVSDCQFSNFAAILWREQVNYQWDDDEVRFILDQHAELDFISADSLRQQSAGRNITPFGHIILIPSQPILALSP